MTEPFNSELCTAGIQTAAFHIERGARSFVAYARAMERDLGRAIRPYLRLFYEGVRHYPGFDATGMTPQAEVGVVQGVLRELEAIEAEETGRSVSSTADTVVSETTSGTRPTDAREAGNFQGCPEVVLQDTETAEGDFRRIVARIDASGDLVLAGHDIGPRVQAAWGHDDYEYQRTVPAEHVARVLLELLKDQFTRDGELRLWLTAKGIPSRLASW